MMMIIIHIVGDGEIFAFYDVTFAWRVDSRVTRTCRTCGAASQPRSRHIKCYVPDWVN